MWRYQLVRRVHQRGSKNEEITIAVHEAFYDSPYAVVPDSISYNPTVPSERTVSVMGDALRRMAKATDYPLLNWDGFGEGATEPKFVFACERCGAVTLGAEPILKCPQPHREGT